MDTKWKHIRNNTYVKLIVIFICIAVIIFWHGRLLVNTIEIYKNKFVEEVLLNRKIEESNLLWKRFREAKSGVETIEKLGDDYLLAKENNFYYFVETLSGKKYTNNKNLSKADFKKSKFFVIQELKKDLELNVETSIKSIDAKDIVPFNSYELIEDEESIENKNRFKTVYFAFSEEFAKELEKKWEGSKTEFSKLFLNAVLAALNVLIAAFVLTIFTGKNDKNGKIKTVIIDYIPSEFALASIPVFFYLYLKFLYDFISKFSEMRIPYLVLSVSAFYALPLSLYLIILYTTIVRKIKAKVFFKYSLIGFLLNTPLHVISLFMRGRASHAQKILSASIVYIFTSMILMATLLSINVHINSNEFLVVFVLEVLLTIWYMFLIVRNTKTMTDELNEKIKAKMKSEMTKTTLITNVSHDLKTPLTSIIGYIALLKKDESLNEESKNYVDILDKKSSSFKVLLEDLFEISKSISGEMPVEIEKLDFKKLIEQTLVDLDDKINSIENEFKITLPNEAIMVNADGNKLYRVIQNLIDNAVRYSLSGTRVFVELRKLENKAVFEIKNTASYEMNFESNDVLSRFVRGDASRTEDGSGLGLSIADSFTKALGGELEITIDGDQFKVELIFDIVE